MKRVEREDIERPVEPFAILTGTEHCQVATMVLQPGEASGEYGNEHAHADQVIYVISGSGEAWIEDRKEPLTQGCAILIEAGERHQIRAGGDEPLITFNVYAPPGY